MGKDGLLFSNRFEQSDFNEILKEMEQNPQKEKRNDTGSGDDFFSFMREHRKLIPNEKRLADKDRFINAVIQEKQGFYKKWEQQKDEIIFIGN